MPPKPQRTLRDRITGYREEAAAYLRRRQEDRKPFARVSLSDGRGRKLGSDTDHGRALFLAAASVIDATTD